ncbi:hypothetical protein BDV11DRAFT_184036 [Aspergillus similis]
MTPALDGAYPSRYFFPANSSYFLRRTKQSFFVLAGCARRAVLVLGVAAASVSAASGSQPDFRSKMPRRARCNYICTEGLGQDPERCKSFHLAHKRKERAGARCLGLLTGTVIWVDDRCQPNITWRTMKSAATDCHARAKGLRERGSAEGKPSRMASPFDPFASGIRTGSRLYRQHIHCKRIEHSSPVNVN